MGPRECWTKGEIGSGGARLFLTKTTRFLRANAGDGGVRWVTGTWSGKEIKSDADGMRLSSAATMRFVARLPNGGNWREGVIEGSH
jgi:hypothetical protein